MTGQSSQLASSTNSVELLADGGDDGVLESEPEERRDELAEAFPCAFLSTTELDRSIGVS